MAAASLKSLVTTETAAIAGAATIAVFIALNVTARHGKLAQGLTAGGLAFVGVVIVRAVGV